MNNDQELIDYARNEIVNGREDKTLWRKALALFAGDIEKAKKKYIRLRVLQLKKSGIPKENSKRQSNNKQIEQTNKTILMTSTEKKEDSSNERSLSGWFIIVIVLIVLGYGVWQTEVNSTISSYSIPNKGQSNYAQNETYYLKIDTYPSNATIKNLSIKPKYSYLSKLKKGDYQIQVSLSGYKTKTFWVRLTKDTTKYTRLEKIYDGKYSVHIQVNPIDANIQILNIKPKFHQGMRLKPGRYDLRVSKQGYITDNTYFEISSDSSYSITLKKDVAKYPLTIQVTPYDAKVQILNIKPKYYDGIQLEKGKYTIRVSKKGYFTQEGIADPSEYSRYEVNLDSKSRPY